MMLIRTKKSGKTDILYRGGYEHGYELLEQLTELFENEQGLRLISEEGALTREFATPETGWECVLMLVEGMCGNININKTK